MYKVRIWYLPRHLCTYEEVSQRSLQLLQVRMPAITNCIKKNKAGVPLRRRGGECVCVCGGGGGVNHNTGNQFESILHDNTSQQSSVNFFSSSFSATTTSSSSFLVLFFPLSPIHVYMFVVGTQAKEVGPCFMNLDI
jgi:hypothetical protein